MSKNTYVTFEKVRLDFQNAIGKEKGSKFSLSCALMKLSTEMFFALIR